LAKDRKSVRRAARARIEGFLVPISACVLLMLPLCASVSMPTPVWGQELSLNGLKAEILGVKIHEDRRPMVVLEPDGRLKQVPPIATACTSCHTKRDAKAHVELEIAPGGRETCAVCHGMGKEFSVAKMHDRR
jgi:hypothetical protein